MSTQTERAAARKLEDDGIWDVDFPTSQLIAQRAQIEGVIAKEERQAAHIAELIRRYRSRLAAVETEIGQRSDS